MMTEIAHWSGLAPAAVVGVRGARRVPWTYRLVAIGFAVSWLAEWYPWSHGGSWAATAYFPIVQFGFFAAAFGGWGLVAMLPWVALVQQVVMPGPDILVTVIGSAGVLYLAHDHRLRWSMWWYCFAGSVLAVFIIALRHDRALFDFVWLPYQACRLVSFGLFGRAAWRMR